MPLRFKDSKYPFKEHKHSHKDYCPSCRRRTEHIRYSKQKMCKNCGYLERR